MLKESRRNSDTRRCEFLRKLGSYARGGEGPQHTTLGRDSSLLENKDILHADNVFLHAGDLGQMRHAPATVAEACNLDDDGDGRSNLLPDGLFGKIQVGHQSHRLYAR